METRGVLRCRGGPLCHQRWGSPWIDLIAHRLGPAVYPAVDRASEARRKGLTAHQVSAVTRLSQGQPPPSGLWAMWVGWAGRRPVGGAGRTGRNERGGGKTRKWGPDGRWKAERENAWLGVILCTGASVQKPVPPIATSSRSRHSGKPRH